MKKADRAEATRQAIQTMWRRSLTDAANCRDGFLFLRMLAGWLEKKGQEITGSLPRPRHSNRAKFDAKVIEAMKVMSEQLEAIRNEYSRGEI